MKNRTRKKILVLGVIGVMTCAMSFGVEAKTLAKSFHGKAIRSYCFAESGKTGRYDVYEQSKAYTKDYTEGKEYYLRAYVGGSKSSASGAVTDTLRVNFTGGDHSITTNKYYYMRDVIGSDTALKYCGSGYGLTCYAKYGYKK